MELTTLTFKPFSECDSQLSVLKQEMPAVHSFHSVYLKDALAEHSVTCCSQKENAVWRKAVLITSWDIFRDHISVIATWSKP